ncbi:hypothetical protein JW964_17040 [candidate division KSB1 bacterium]|nr:hypothetical protein [candidate division KSB1 bacterium]
MAKRVIIAGLSGGVVLLIWTFIVNAIFGFASRMEMKQIPNERQVYEILKENIIEPGKYLCNPALTVDGRFPDNEPVFSVLYGGVGHEFAGKMMLFGFLIFFLAPMTAAWLLSQASPKVLSSYWRKVLFFTAIGLLFALFDDLNNFGIGNYPLGDALIRAVYNICVWTVVGLVVAWQMKPEKVPETN